MDVDKQVDNSSLTEEEAILIKKKEKCVSCRNMSKLFAFPFISPIFMAIRDIMNGPLLNANIKRDAKSFYFGYGMGSCVFLTLGGIIYFFIDIKACAERVKSDTTMLYKKRDTEVKKISKTKLAFILFAMCCAFSLHIVSICLSMYYTLLDKRIYTMFITGFYARWILGRQVNSYHKFAFVVYTFGFVIFLVFTCIHLKVRDLLPNLFSILGAIVYSMQYSLMKFLQVNYNWPIYFSHMIVGTFATVFSIIGYFKTKTQDATIAIFYENIKEKKLLANLIVYVIAGITAKVLVAFTIYHFTLMHFVFSCLISAIILFIYNNCRDPSKAYIIVLCCVGFVIELFALLVYNENIVINRYGLNENMGKGITERERKEREIRAENDIKKKIIYDIEENLYEDENEEEEKDDNKNKIEMGAT